jgi:arabinose-5-phosphate isomerase
MSSSNSHNDWIDLGKSVIRQETKAMVLLEHSLDDSFAQVVAALLICPGRIVTTGMGKAGLIARKVAATFASTGAPAFFMHPAEGIHGDLGMVTAEDLVIAFSNAGQTEEVLRILPYLKHFKTPIVAITSNPESELAKNADWTLKIPVETEACPMGLAPTTSTTAMLALGDALALVLLEARGFAPEDYALRHPGGSLGRRLLTKVQDLMHSGSDNPVVPETATLQDAILTMTKSKLAATSVVNADGVLTGFFTDGDLRRHLLTNGAQMNQPISEVMTRNPKRAWPDMMAVKALEILREHKIIELPVCNEFDHPVGMIHLHDITRAGIT